MRQQCYWPSFWWSYPRATKTLVALYVVNAHQACISGEVQHFLCFVWWSHFQAITELLTMWPVKGPQDNKRNAVSKGILGQQNYCQPSRRWRLFTTTKLPSHYMETSQGNNRIADYNVVKHHLTRTLSLILCAMKSPQATIAFLTLTVLNATQFSKQQHYWPSVWYWTSVRWSYLRVSASLLTACLVRTSKRSALFALGVVKAPYGNNSIPDPFFSKAPLGTDSTVCVGNTPEVNNSNVYPLYG